VLARSNDELLKADHRHPSLHFKKVGCEVVVAAHAADAVIR
jgi:hypothetical protein